MRAPSGGAYFEIPYSGTHASGDCILVVPSTIEGPSIDAYYDRDKWVYKDYIISFSDENNVISFCTSNILSGGNAALIPGPNHV